MGGSNEKPAVEEPQIEVTAENMVQIVAQLREQNKVLRQQIRELQSQVDSARYTLAFAYGFARAAGN